MPGPGWYLLSQSLEHLEVGQRLEEPVDPGRLLAQLAGQFAAAHGLPGGGDRQQALQAVDQALVRLAAGRRHGTGRSSRVAGGTSAGSGISYPDVWSSSNHTPCCMVFF